MVPVLGERQVRLAFSLIGVWVTEVVLEERGQLVEGDEIDAVIEIHVTGAGNDHQFLGLAGKPVALFAELPGMCLLARDEEHRTRRNRLDVREW